MRNRRTRCLTGAIAATAAAAFPSLAVAQPAPPPAWHPFEAGYVVDAAVTRGGRPALRCANASPDDKRGAEIDFALNQTKPAPVVLTGWSRAENVGGTPNSDYSLYCDLTYDDGSHVWGYAAAFDTGTHDWQRRRITITPDRPIKSLAVYGLLRGGHTGTAWFADFAATPLAGAAIFDSQPLAPPKLAAGQASGWFVRDVAAGGAIVPLTPGGKAAAGGLSLGKVTADHAGQVLHAALSSAGAKNRAVTLYYVERFAAPAGGKPVTWWRTIRETQAAADSETTNAVAAGDVGATGTQAKYPFACVTSEAAGRALAIPPDLGPRVARLGYHPASRLLYAAFDLALMPGRPPATVAVARYPVSAAWGLRDAARGYYALYPEYYAKRTKTEGIWMPFTAPSSVPHPEDFGFGWHEGDNSVASDDRLGILSLRYAEPMSYWMPMDKGVPRDYDTAYAQLQRIASGTEVPKTDPEAQRRQALAALSSGARTADGKLNVRFENAPWCDGAVWTLSPDPALPAGPGGWNKARVNYDVADADKRYGRGADNGYQGGILDGEYLDSTESWATVLNYGAESLKRSPSPPVFDADSYRPTIPTWFSVWEYMAWLRADLRKRGKLLMGNSTPWTIDSFAALLDSAGTETNWLAGDDFQPESDAMMSWRRTLMGRKPYLLLLNLDFDKFPAEYVERYCRRCVFYGIFPSFFSVNAADHPYWENPKLYERDRPTFKKYVPIVKTLSAAGWEPVTLARSSDPTVWVERYGDRYLTVLNSGKETRKVTLTLDRALTGGRPVTAVRDLLNPSFSDAIVTYSPGAPARITLTLPPEGVAALQLDAAAAVTSDFPGASELLQDGLLGYAAIAPDGALCAWAFRRPRPSPSGYGFGVDVAVGIPGRGPARALWHSDLSEIHGLAFSSGGKTLVLGGSKPVNRGAVELCDPFTGDIRERLTGQDRVVLTVAVSPDGRFLAYATERSVRVRDLHARRELWAAPPTNGASLLVFSPDSRTLAATGVASGNVSIWDALSGKPGPEIKTPQKWIEGMAFTADSRTLFTAGDDDTIRTWDPATGEQRQVYAAPAHSFPQTLAVSPDGRRIYLGGDNGTNLEGEQPILCLDLSKGRDWQEVGRAPLPIDMAVLTPDGTALTGVCWMGHFTFRARLAGNP